MPTASLRLCSGCKRKVRGPCPYCTKAARFTTDRRRGTSTERGYDHHWRTVVRPAFLRDNPLCCLCGALAEVPDHYPETRKELLARGVRNPDEPKYLRPLCLSCHARHGRR
ncbi:MAG TPA: hypothetical protein VJ851_00700 [Jatrophihabitans sp.]|nr:hypothetical protein [Jatrophihabitans sp.]